MVVLAKVLKFSLFLPLKRARMSELSSIARTFAAYLIRPHLYPELGRKIYKNVFDRKSAFKGKEDAEGWCRNLAVSQQDAVKSLGFENFAPLTSLYPEAFAFANEAEQNCPVKMGGAGALDLIYYLAEFSRAQNVLETGVAYGWSSLAALLSLKNRGGTLYSSDMPYLGKDNDRYVGCVVPQELKPYWKLYRYADRESLPKIFGECESFDFIHYDSDKSYKGRMWAYPVLWERLRKGGVLMSDDVGDNAAFMDYCVQQGHQPVIVEFDGKYAGYIIKQ